MNTWCTGRPFCKAGSGCLLGIRLLGCPANSQACPVASTLISIQMHTGTASGRSVCFHALLAAENLIAPSDYSNFAANLSNFFPSCLSHTDIFNAELLTSNVSQNIVKVFFSKLVPLLNQLSSHQLCFQLCWFLSEGSSNGTGLSVLAQSRPLQKDAQCGERSDVIVTLCGIVSVEPYRTLVYVYTPTVAASHVHLLHVCIQACLWSQKPWMISE